MSLQHALHDGPLHTPAAAVHEPHLPKTGGSGLALDLQSFYLPPLTGIETVDLTGVGDNAFFLDASDIGRLSNVTHVLIVQGDAGDQVVADLPGFVDLGSMNGFHAWSRGALTLVVADAVEAFVTP